MKKIKELIDVYLKETGETKVSLASKLGIAQNTFYSKINGDTEFKWSEIDKLAEILGCTVDDLRD